MKFIEYKGKSPNGCLIINQWNYEKNIIKPEEINYNSMNEYYFNCSNCYHSFEIKLNKIVRENNWCSYCSNPPKRLCKNLNCDHCYMNSLASFNTTTKSGNFKLAYLNKKLNNAIPRFIFKSANIKLWFDCDYCPHSFEIIVKDLTCLNRDRWCSYCCSSSDKLCENKKCVFCYNKSLASYKSRTGNNNLKISLLIDDIRPRMLPKGSGKIIKFKCDVCTHPFKRKLYDVTYLKKWCPYCQKYKRKFCGNINCKPCFNNSFALYQGKRNGIKVVDLWNKEKNKNDKPYTITLYSNKKCYFDCPECKKIILIHIYDIVNGKWCSTCKNKTEKIFLKYLRDNYTEYNIIHQGKYDWCKRKNFLPFDFVLKKLKLIIEIDGDQHFKQVANWKSPKVTLENDIYKMKKALENNFTIIRILQEDIYYNKIEWKKIVKEKIKKYNIPTVICIGCQIKYKNHLIL